MSLVPSRGIDYSKWNRMQDEIDIDEIDPREVKFCGRCIKAFEEKTLSSETTCAEFKHQFSVVVDSHIKCTSEKKCQNPMHGEKNCGILNGVAKAELLDETVIACGNFISKFPENSDTSNIYKHHLAVECHINVEKLMERYRKLCGLPPLEQTPAQ